MLTNSEVNGFAIFTYTPTGQAAVAPLQAVPASSYLLAFDNTGEVSTGLAIANQADSAANVNVVVRNDAGVQIGSGTVQLPAQGHNSFMLTDSTYGFPATAGLRGTVEFDTPANGRISVLGLRANAIPNGGGFAVTSLPTLTNAGTGGGVMPHFASGGGWQTTFTLVNTGPASATATLSFFGDSGAAVSLPLSFPQTNTSATASSVSQTIPAGGSLIVLVEDSGGATSTEGSALLATTGDVGGFAVFRYNPTGQEAVSPLQTASASDYVLPFDNTGSLATGVAITNLGATPATVTALLWDDAGVNIGQWPIQIPAMGHTSFMLTDTASGGSAAAQGIRGTIELVGGLTECHSFIGFCYSSPVNIAPLGLRANTISGGAFTITSIPVMVRQTQP